MRLAEVLALLDFVPRRGHGPQLRGPCPVHRSPVPTRRSFAAHLGKNAWPCFGCGAGGNALDLWVAVTCQPLHAAVLDRYRRLGRDVPWLRRRQRPSPTAPRGETRCPNPE